MLSLVRTATEKERYYLFGTFIIDASVGIVALVLTIPIALLLGGFSFFTPWVLVIALLMFTVGTIRGNSIGNIWLKSVSLNAGWLLTVGLTQATFNGIALAVVFGASFTVLPAAAGIALRRNRLLRSS